MVGIGCYDTVTVVSYRLHQYKRSKNILVVPGGSVHVVCAKRNARRANFDVANSDVAHDPCICTGDGFRLLSK